MLGRQERSETKPGSGVALKSLLELQLAPQHSCLLLPKRKGTVVRDPVCQGDLQVRLLTRKSVEKWVTVMGFEIIFMRKTYKASDTWGQRTQLKRKIHSTPPFVWISMDRYTRDRCSYPEDIFPYF